MRLNLEKPLARFEKLGINDPAYIDELYSRPSWDDYFLDLAISISKRSHDSQTQHGCLIVKDNRILSSGYNGFPSGSNDKIIPNIRKDNKKYPFINHAEISAIFNCAKNGISLDGSKIYITGKPCHNCAKALVSVGILDWVIGNKGHVSSEEEDLLYEFWVQEFGVKVNQVK